VARDFCYFIAEYGIRHWAEVSQRHYDQYMQQKGRSQGANVHPFLTFVGRNYRLSAKFIAPKRKPAPALTRVTALDEMPEVVNQISKIVDDELRVIGLLLAIYAQPISRSAALTASRFRFRAERLEALFGDDWLPLDRMTSKLLLELEPALK